MTRPESPEPQRRRRPPPQPDERMGWGAWVLVALCILVGAGVLLFLRGRVVRATRMEEPAGTSVVVAGAPAAQPTRAASPGPGDRPARPLGEGEGRVTTTPQEGLRVLWATPKLGTTVYPHEVLTVQFSSAMNQESLRTALEITPPVAGTMEWPRRDQLVYRPSRPLEMGATYKVALTGYAQNMSRQEYLQPHGWAFEVYRAYSFKSNVGRILRHGCGECHSPGRPAARVLLDSYERVMPYVQKGNSAASPLIAALNNPRTHSQVRPEARRLLYVIRDWIDRFDAAE